MTAPDSPCYLCQRRTLGCHIWCKDYKTFTQWRQELSQAMQTEVGLQSYACDRYFKVQREIHNRR